MEGLWFFLNSSWKKHIAIFEAKKFNCEIVKFLDPNNLGLDPDCDLDSPTKSMDPYPKPNLLMNMDPKQWIQLNFSTYIDS